MPINETHDPNLRSWLESANDPASDFPIQNLPLCVFMHADQSWRIGAPIGDRIVDLASLASSRALDVQNQWGPVGFESIGVEQLAEFGAAALRTVRSALISALKADADPSARRAIGESLRPFNECRVDVPTLPRNYTDFYASIHHAQTVGSMFRPDSPLLPNYKWVPIGYHGRASSIVPSGTSIRRPRGQQAPPENDPKASPAFGPCKMLDYELEVGLFVGPGNSLGQPIPIGRAEEHIFGLCLVNDWSARDIQKWEYQPLGPFLAKNFATTISPYIVTLEALEPFRCPAYKRPDGDPRSLPYLFSETDQARGGFDITLEVYLQSEQMRTRGLSPILLSKSNAFKEMYWTPAQMLTHHASNGCNLQPGDLLASGTVSGPGPTERGCLLELTWDGNGPDGKPKPRKPIQLPTGETRTFLADGDDVIMKGYCERDGFRRIGFGECRGRITPAE
jgi:fumarylacetoacetase